MIFMCANSLESTGVSLNFENTACRDLKQFFVSFVIHCDLLCCCLLNILNI